MENGQDTKIIFHCAREGRKIDYLKLRPQAAFVVVEDATMLPDKFSTAYASAMVSGRVAIVDDPEAKRELLKFFVLKLAPEYLGRGDKHIEHRLHECLVLQMEIVGMCGKRRKLEEPYALAHLGF
jgi:nitroimidazol reductase NimA-like FMN-containing flavoprotein (pyridoxamine 5'-phosphate oxidase superfamily)